MPLQVDCPCCGRRSEFSPENRWRPFCSQRCRQIDLGAWASNQYVVAGDNQDEPRDDDERDTNGGR